MHTAPGKQVTVMFCRAYAVATFVVWLHNILHIPIEGHMDTKTMNWPQVCEGGSESVVIWCEVEAQTTCRSLTRKVGLKINSVAGLR